MVPVTELWGPAQQGAMSHAFPIRTVQNKVGTGGLVCTLTERDTLQAHATSSRT